MLSRHMKLGKIIKVTAIVSVVTLASAGVSNAETWSTYGNQTYGSDGTTYSQYGNQTYGSYGSGGSFSCSTYGNQTYCN